MKRLIVTVLFLLTTMASWAQCAMCRATMENNVSNGDVGIAAGINFGILYLFAAPYVLIGVLGYVWYKNARK